MSSPAPNQINMFAVDATRLDFVLTLPFPGLTGIWGAGGGGW